MAITKKAPITKQTLEGKDDKGKKARTDTLLSYNLNFEQDFDDKTGEPIGSPILNSMSIDIRRSSGANVPYYIKWQLEHSATRDLDICFYNQNHLKRSIKIKKAYLIGYSQRSSSPGTIEETLKISPESIEIDGETFNRNEES